MPHPAPFATLRRLQIKTITRAECISCIRIWGYANIRMVTPSRLPRVKDSNNEGIRAILQGPWRQQSPADHQSLASRRAVCLRYPVRTEELATERLAASVVPEEFRDGRRPPRRLPHVLSSNRLQGTDEAAAVRVSAPGLRRPAAAPKRYRAPQVRRCSGLLHPQRMEAVLGLELAESDPIIFAPDNPGLKLSPEEGSYAETIQRAFSLYRQLGALDHGRGPSEHQGKAELQSFQRG